MARVAEAALSGRLTGLAVVPHGVEARLERIELFHAGHPIPDEASVEAAERLLGWPRRRAGIWCSCCSAAARPLWPACRAKGLTSGGEAALTAALLRSGAPIGEINCVRRHISRIKGGRALAAAPARCYPRHFRRGRRPRRRISARGRRSPIRPRSPTPGRCWSATALDRAGWSETPKRVAGEFRIVAGAPPTRSPPPRRGARGSAIGRCCSANAQARRATSAAAHAEARARAPRRAARSDLRRRADRDRDRRRDAAAAIVEYALAAAPSPRRPRPDIIGLAADTDGIDGTSGAAGALFGGVARPAGAAEALAAQRRRRLFARGDLFVTGPTGTNVNDLRIILVKGDSYE